METGNPKLQTSNYTLHLTPYALRLAPRTGLRVSSECFSGEAGISCTGKHHYYNAVIQLLLSDERILSAFIGK